MITIIFGAPGSGKSSLNTYFLKQVYRREGRSRLERAKELIGQVNEERATPLTVPDQPPIFANYRVKFKTGYEKWFEPYFVNGYYLGLANENMPTQYIPPASAVFLGEAQRFFNSRKSQTLPDWVSRFYEMHRHYHVDFYMDVQRPGLIDANLREICKNFIEVRGMEHEKDSAGRIVHTKFRCRKFGDWTAVEQYLKTGEGAFEEVSFENDGDIFRAFDSYSYFGEFLPKEGQDFKLLPFLGQETSKSAADAVFYGNAEPAAYRGMKPPAQKDGKNKEKKGKKSDETRTA